MLLNLSVMKIFLAKVPSVTIVGSRCVSMSAGPGLEMEMADGR